MQTKPSPTTFEVVTEKLSEDERRRAKVAFNKLKGQRPQTLITMLGEFGTGLLKPSKVEQLMMAIRQRCQHEKWRLKEAYKSRVPDMPRSTDSISDAVAVMEEIESLLALQITQLGIAA